MKGVVIMTNINLQKREYVSYSQVYLNSQKVGGVTSYNKILQNKLTVFSDLLSNCFPRLIDYVRSINLENHSYELGLYNDILYEYNHNQKKGIPLLITLSNQLNDKKIDKDTFEFLLKIIEHQEVMTKEIVNKTFTIDRVETVFNHLREVPYYLKTDLEIESLPIFKSLETVIINDSQDADWEIIKSDYDPDKKDIA